MFHIFGVEYFVALYGHLSRGVDGDNEGDVEVATRIADAGGEAQSLGCDHVEDEAFEHAVLPEVSKVVLKNLLWKISWPSSDTSRSMWLSRKVSPEASSFTWGREGSASRAM